MLHRVVSLAAGLLTVSFGAAQAADAIPAKPEPGTVKIGVQPWLGYGPWHIAAAKGFFKKNGLEDVQIVNFSEQKDIDAAMAGGQLDAASVPTHSALVVAQTGTTLKTVLLLDFSLKADAIMAKGVDTVKDFKGKQVAFEEGSTSDVLINYALAQNGMSINDIQRVPMPAAQAGSALIAGQVPISVTYEPYLTVALGQDKAAKIVYSAGEDPGLISDVLTVHEDMIKTKPGQILALVNPGMMGSPIIVLTVQEGRAIIAKAVGSTPEELATAFDGVKFYSVSENAEHLGKDFESKTIEDVAKAAKAAKILQSDAVPGGFIDSSFVEAAGK